MTASIILKKFILEPLKKSLIWYLEQTAKSGICVTGTFPASYYEYQFRRDYEARNSRKE